MERKGAAEVSRESQVEARERLVKELEGSAKRAQQVDYLSLERFEHSSALTMHAQDRAWHSSESVK